MNIVLHEPGIALNTGNIGRTCAATNTSLHLIRPYGFHITEKEIRRAGMDYWDKIDLHEYVDYGDFLAEHKNLIIEGHTYQERTVNCESFFEGHAYQELTGNHESFFEGPRRDGLAEQPETELAEHNHSEPVSYQADSNAECKAPGIAAQPKLWFATTKARQSYTDVSFGPNDYIMLGNESRGIPEEILAEHPKACIRIPMWGDIRSLNLANSAAIILYEALRQNGFEHMAKQGNLHRLSWNESNKI